MQRMCRTVGLPGKAGAHMTDSAEGRQMKNMVEEIMNEKVPDGSAVLRWLGQMGLLVKMGKTVLCIDYFASDLPGRQVAPPIPMKEVTGIDLFLGIREIHLTDWLQLHNVLYYFPYFLHCR